MEQERRSLHSIRNPKQRNPLWKIRRQQRWLLIANRMLLILEKIKVKNMTSNTDKVNQKKAKIQINSRFTSGQVLNILRYLPCW